MFGDTKKLAEEIVGSSEEQAPADGDDSGMEAAAEQLLGAVKSADAAGVVTAFKAMLEIMESKPHEEAGETE